ncbi:MAG: hypothetical protein PF569_02440 [Candidatus Woesearchaeota archaeon]|jgi:hypothetical protein|nr:hypothetical protein [Candidatus Woesearchaeota archaeon]
MSGFSFDATAGASQSTVKPRLEGNAIYTVKLDSCEIEDIQGVKDPSAVYKVLKIKFSNEDGAFENTVFEPREEDFNRGESKFTNKNGNEEKIPQPSNVESMMLLFKHMIDAFAPTVGKEIDEGKKQIAAPDWDKLRVVVKKILDTGKDSESKIKLIKTKSGEARFPGFFAAINREGTVYVRNNFIGTKVAFTPYELTRIQKEKEAVPTNTEELVNKPEVEGKESDLDLDFNL